MMKGLHHATASLARRKERLVQLCAFGALLERDRGVRCVHEACFSGCGGERVELCAAFRGEVSEIVEGAIEGVRVDGWVGGWRVHEQELAFDVVFEDGSRGTALVRLPETLREEPSGAGESSEDFLAGWDPGTAFFDMAGVDAHAVDSFQEGLRDALSHERGGTGVLA